MTRPSGTVTFLFTDVEGSTRLWAADKDAMSASLLVHDSVLRAAIEGNGGYVFTTSGDSFAAAFGRASDAVRAATESQRALSNAGWPGPTLKVRMGLHLGEAEERGGDYFGPVVNTAARVEAAGHGGQVLITDAVRTAAGTTDVTDLGMRTLRDVAEQLRLFQLGTDTFPALRVIDPSLSNLPVRPTRLIGRETDMARIRTLLTESRLVTVTAIGGSGKTRLAIAVGEAELPHHRSGVWFVDLTAVSNGADVPAAIANGLGLNLTTGDQTAQILTFLADKQALVILDNCEHLIEESAAFVEAFLATKSSAKILATSREAFDLDGERVVILGSLPTDTADSPAVRLFVDRATAVHPEFTLTDTNTPTVSAICTRLDGMPLAIELAAARITVMNPDELLAGLDSRFQLLSGGRRRSRQRTLEATLDWSYDLLTTEEQRVLRALGVFVDGFDVDAVAVVTNLDRRTATGHIETLQAKSLVVRADKRKSTRFRLLETVKAYAEDRLVDTGEAEKIRDRHLEHFHSLAMAEGRKVMGSLDVGLRLRHDCPNVTAAFEWAAQHDEWITAGELLTACEGAYYLDVRFSEFNAALGRSAAQIAELDPDLHGCITVQRFWSFMMLADVASAVTATSNLTRSPLNPFRAIGWALNGWLSAFNSPENVEMLLARSANERNQPTHSEPLLSDAVAWAHPEVLPLFAREVVALMSGDFEQLRDVSPELTGVWRAVGPAVRIVGVAIAEVLLAQPRAALATVAQLDEFDLPFQDGTEVRALAHLALGDPETALVHIRRLATRAATGAYLGESDDAMLMFAALAHHQGDDETARRFLLNAGQGRQPGTIAYGRHLARKLNIADAYLKQSQVEMGVVRSMKPLRAELTRRGWD